MNMRRLSAALLCPVLLLVSGCDRTGGDPASVDAYAIKTTLQPAPGGNLQRVPLPPAVMVALQRADMADLRIFDAKGKALPVALLDPEAGRAADERSVVVPAIPILGAPGSFKPTGVSLRIDEDHQAHIVRVDGTVEPVASDAAMVLGVLLDTRAIADPVTAIRLDVNLPKQRPVTFSFEASDDLKTWQPLAEKVLFRAGEGPSALGADSVALPSADLHDRYVRVRWDEGAGPALAATPRSATITSSKVRSPRRLEVAATSPELVDPHEVRFALPFATRVDALRITLAGRDGVVPVRLYGRNERDEPWTPLAAGTLREPGGAVLELGPEIGPELGPELGGATFRTFRIEADKRTGGFSEAPRLALLLRPAELAVQFDGVPPYTLAAGLANAPDIFLTTREIAPGGKDAGISGLPAAKVVAQAGSAPQVKLSPVDGQDWFSGRRAVLWLVLVAATALLGFAVLRLARPARSAD